MTTSYLRTWDETKPAGSRSRSLGDDDIRDFKAALRERLEEDHLFYEDESGHDDVGYHRKVTLPVLADDPAAVESAGIIYTKDVDGKAELFFEDEDSNVLQITSKGVLANGVLENMGLFWIGTVASIPAGYHLCDGDGGTPDLRDKFIVCAKQDDGGIAKTNITGSLLQTGGATTHDHGAATGSHVLTVDEIPEHYHTYSKSTQSSGTEPDNDGGAISGVIANTSSTGGGQGHTHTVSSASNIPTFYALALIMKTS